LSKATLCQLLIVACLLSVISDVTPLPPPQVLPHRDKDVGGDHIATPPHPRATAAHAASPAPRRGSSFSSPPCYSCHAEPRGSATWPMINAARCGAKSPPSGGAVVPVWGRTCRRCPGPGSSPCGGVARGAAPGSGVGDRGGGAGFVARPPPSLFGKGYASVTAGRMPGDMDQDLHRLEAWLGNRRHLAGMIRAVIPGPPPQGRPRSCGRGGILLRHGVAPGGAWYKDRLEGSVVCTVNIAEGGCGCGGGGVSRYH
jgi:hypothetical protein